jgi:hypothetical protein
MKNKYMKVIRKKISQKLRGLIIIATMMIGWGATYPAQANETLDKIISGAIFSVLLWPIKEILKIELHILPFIAQYNSFISETGVVKGWEALRNLSNMFFIVILLIIAFATILKIQSYGYKRLLKKLIMVAILINFSRLIVGVLIDFSQIVMLSFISPIVIIFQSNVVTALGLGYIMDSDGTGSGGVLNNQIAAYFLGAIMLLIAMIVFLVFIVMLVMRIVTLWVLTVVSPIMFLASAFPKTDRYFTDWSEELMKNLFSGPTLAFFLWLTFFIVGKGTVSTTIIPAGTIVDKGTVVADGEPISKSAEPSNVVNYIVAISMLILGLKMAQQSGAAGASFAGNMAGKLKSMPGKAWEKTGLQQAGTDIAKKWGKVAAAPLAVTKIPALLYHGTSGQGMIKGGIERVAKGGGGWAVQKAGEGVSKVSGGIAGGLDKVGLGGVVRGMGKVIPFGGHLQRVGMRFQGEGQKDRRDQTEETRKGGENVADQEAYLATVGGKQGVALRGKAKLDNNEKFDDPKEVEELKKVLQSMGDTASLRKLQAKVASANDEDSINANINKNGVEDTFRQMNFDNAYDTSGNLVKGALDAMRIFLEQDAKEQQSAIDRMSKANKESFMAAMNAYNVNTDSGIKKSKDKDEIDASGKLVKDSIAARRAMLLTGNDADRGGKLLNTLATSADPKDQTRAKAIAEARAADIDIKTLLSMDSTPTGDPEAFKLLAQNLNGDLTSQFLSRCRKEEDKQRLVDAQLEVGKNTDLLVKTVPGLITDKSKITQSFDVQIAAATNPTVRREELATANLSQARYAFNNLNSPTDRRDFADYIIKNLTADQAKAIGKPTLGEINTELLAASSTTQMEALRTSLLKALKDQHGIDIKP